MYSADIKQAPLHRPRIRPEFILQNSIDNSKDDSGEQILNFSAQNGRQRENGDVSPQNGRQGDNGYLSAQNGYQGDNGDVSAQHGRQGGKIIKNWYSVSTRRKGFTMGKIITVDIIYSTKKLYSCWCVHSSYAHRLV